MFHRVLTTPLTIFESQLNSDSIANCKDSLGYKDKTHKILVTCSITEKKHATVRLSPQLLPDVFRSFQNE